MRVFFGFQRVGRIRKKRLLSNKTRTKNAVNTDGLFMVPDSPESYPILMLTNMRAAVRLRLHSRGWITNP
jgi:hypothetical protein